MPIYIDIFSLILDKTVFLLGI